MDGFDELTSIDNISDAEFTAYAGLQSLVMDWGLRPCWVETSIDEGIGFLRRFPKLKKVTLLVEFSEYDWPQNQPNKSIIRCKKREVKRIGTLVRTSARRIQGQNPKWRAPEIHVVHRTKHWSRKDAQDAS